MLKLIKPGIRGNKYYVARGTVGGRRVEVTTGTTDKIAAERFRAETEVELLRRNGLLEIGTYAEAAHEYLERKKDKTTSQELKMHLQIVRELGRKSLVNIRQGEIDRCAETLYPNAKASTRNRWAIRPIADVMHYASQSGHCPWLRIKKFREEKPKTRAVTKNIAALIIDAAGKQSNKPEIKTLIVKWMFKHGNRISEILSVRSDDIDFKLNNFKLNISKTKSWKEFALDKEVKTALRKAFPKGLPEGRLFPWTHRWSVYKWLRPMCKEIGVPFTPHVARHSLGTWYANAGAGLRATMSRLGHDDVKSSMRYQNEDIEITRQVNRKLGRIGVSVGKNNAKRKS